MDQNNGGIIGKINTPTTSVASGVWSLDSQFDSQASSTWPLAFPQTTIANSCRFNAASSDNLSRTPSSTSNRRTFTFSTWFKLSGTDGSFISAGTDISNGPLFIIDILSGSNEGILRIEDSIGGSNVIGLRTNRLLRDVSAWMHIVVAIDTTQSTASDRVKLYINGTQETSFNSSYSTYPSQNLELSMNQNHETRIGTRAANTSGKFWDGYMAETILVDGQQLLPTSFGAFNPVPNIWEPIAYTGTYGTNGFRLDYADSSALGNDVSGNDNDFTVNNLTSIDQSTDTCSNNFATMNRLDLGATTGGEFLQGNLDVHMGGTAKGVYYSTIGVSTGKWYVEVNPDSGSGGNSYIGVSGNTNDGGRGANDYLGARSNDYGFYQDDGKVYSSGTGATYGSSYSNGNIIGVYLDLDNNKLYFSINGSLQNSGTGVSITDPASTQQGAYFFCVGDDNAFAERRFNMNFGSPIESISSGNTDGEFGNFEYSTTITGDGASKTFKALCTKNLAESG